MLSLEANYKSLEKEVELWEKEKSEKTDKMAAEIINGISNFKKELEEQKRRIETINFQQTGFPEKTPLR